MAGDIKPRVRKCCSMEHDRLERAIELGKKVEHFFVALMGSGGFPYVNAAYQIEPILENRR